MSARELTEVRKEIMSKDVKLACAVCHSLSLEDRQINHYFGALYITFIIIYYMLEPQPSTIPYQLIELDEWAVGPQGLHNACPSERVCPLASFGA